MDGHTYVEDPIITRHGPTSPGGSTPTRFRRDYTAEAFIKVLDPANNFTESLYETQNLTARAISRSRPTSASSSARSSSGASGFGRQRQSCHADSLGSMTVTTMPSSGPSADRDRRGQRHADAGPGGLAHDPRPRLGHQDRGGHAGVRRGQRLHRAHDRLGRHARGGQCRCRRVERRDGRLRGHAGGRLGHDDEVAERDVAGGTLSAATLAVDAATGIETLAHQRRHAWPVRRSRSSGPAACRSSRTARVTVAVGSLDVTETAGGGRIDLGAGQVSVAAGGISAADLRADIIAGRNGGAWNGTAGITSSAAAVVRRHPGGRLRRGRRRVGHRLVRRSRRHRSQRAGQRLRPRRRSTRRASSAAASAADWSQGDFNYDGVDERLRSGRDRHRRRLRTGQLLPGRPDERGRRHRRRARTGRARARARRRRGRHRPSPPQPAPPIAKVLQ